MPIRQIYVQIQCLRIENWQRYIHNLHFGMPIHQRADKRISDKIRNLFSFRDKGLLLSKRRWKYSASIGINLVSFWHRSINTHLQTLEEVVVWTRKGLNKLADILCPWWDEELAELKRRRNRAFNKGQTQVLRLRLRWKFIEYISSKGGTYQVTPARKCFSVYSPSTNSP